MKHSLKLLPAALLAISMGAQAAVTVTIQEVGGDVVVRGVGTINTANMACDSGGDDDGEVEVNPTSINTKDVGNALIMQPKPLMFIFGNPEINQTCFLNTTERTGPGIASEPEDPENPEQFEGRTTSGNFAFADLYDTTFGNGLALALPANYSGEASLEFSGVFEGQSLDDLGLIAGGNYKWTWSTEPNIEEVSVAKAEGIEDFLQVTVLGAAAPTSATPVPTVGIFGLMGLASAIGAAGIAMNRRRKQS